MAGLGLLLLGLEPVGESGGLAGSGDVLALDLDGQLLVLLEAAGEVGLLGGLRGGGGAEGLDLADGVGVLDGGGLVGLELLEVELLDEVGCGRRSVLVYDVIAGVVYIRPAGQFSGYLKNWYREIGEMIDIERPLIWRCDANKREDTPRCQHGWRMKVFGRRSNGVRCG